MKSINSFIKFAERMVYRVNTHPVIVLGNQKTGTSAISHLLADCCALSKTIDVPELWYPTLVHLLQGEMTLSQIVKECPKSFSRGLIKEPNLTFVYDQLESVFPGAKFVFVNRDPRDNIRSFLNRLGIPGNLLYMELDDWNIPELWRPAFDAELWRAQYTHYVEILAARWNRAANVYLEQQSEMVLVKYEDFLTNKVGVIEDLAQWLGLPRVNDISDKVDIQYQPPGNHDVSWQEFFGNQNLSRIERICGNKMAKFDYV